MIANEIINKIVSATKEVLPKNLKEYHLHEPTFFKKESEYVQNCIATKMVSSIGGYVNKFENMISKYTGSKYTIATMNGTSALHMMMKVMGIKQNDEVLLPSTTFVATANAICYCQAVPHFVDCNLIDLAICPIKLKCYLDEIAEVKNGICYNRKSQRAIKALLLVHVFGHPAKVDEVIEVCEQYHIPVIEDAAEGLGSWYKNKHVGTFGLMGALSFNGNKIVTAGSAGVILTNNEFLAKTLKRITTTGRVNHPWEYIHDIIAYNYRMSNIHAALGCAQLESLKLILDAKRLLVKQYYQSFKNIKEVQFITEPSNAKSNYWLNAILLSEKICNLKNKLISQFHENKIFVRPLWKPIHTLDIYKDFPCMDNMACTDAAYNRIINLPSSAFLANEDKA